MHTRSWSQTNIVREYIDHGSYWQVENDTLWKRDFLISYVQQYKYVLLIAFPELERKVVSKMKVLEVR
jgi:hypothetical protein